MYTPSPVGDEARPLYQRLARSISDDIRRGRYRPGDRLPGSRKLAEILGVHRNTALAALADLEAEGWVAAEPARGVYVRSDLPGDLVAPLGTGLSPRPGFDLPPDPGWPRPAPRPSGIAMAGGQPDTRLLPLEELARAARRALRSRGHALLDYGDPQGLPTFRAGLARWLSEKRGLALGPDDLLVTRGSQMALYLAASALLRPGDRVAVEALGYGPAWRALRAAGATLLPLPVDGDGLDVDALIRLDPPPRAVYLTPHHQFPTGAVLSAGRRLRLLDWARRQRVAVLEDDFDHEVHYRGAPVLPLAASDPAGVVLYVGTLSKTFAPGVRTGVLVAPRALLERAVRLRVLVDRQGDQVTEAALAELLADGTLERHLRRIVRIYAQRRELLLSLLAERLPDALEVTPTVGGMALWARVISPVPAEAWSSAAAAEGVHVSAGQEYSFDAASVPFLRLGYAALDEAELREAVRRLERGLRRAARLNR